MLPRTMPRSDDNDSLLNVRSLSDLIFLRLMPLIAVPGLLFTNDTLRPYYANFGWLAVLLGLLVLVFAARVAFWVFAAFKWRYAVILGSLGFAAIPAAIFLDKQSLDNFAVIVTAAVYFIVYHELISYVIDQTEIDRSHISAAELAVIRDGNHYSGDRADFYRGEADIGRDASRFPDLTFRRKRTLNFRDGWYKDLLFDRLIFIGIPSVVTYYGWTAGYGDVVFTTPGSIALTAGSIVLLYVLFTLFWRAAMFGPREVSAIMAAIVTAPFLLLLQSPAEWIADFTGLKLTLATIGCPAIYYVAYRSLLRRVYFHSDPA